MTVATGRAINCFFVCRYWGSSLMFIAMSSASGTTWVNRKGIRVFHKKEYSTSCLSNNRICVLVPANGELLASRSKKIEIAKNSSYCFHRMGMRHFCLCNISAGLGSGKTAVMKKGNYVMKFYGNSTALHLTVSSL